MTPLLSKALLASKSLKWRMTVKQKVTKENRTNTGEAKWTNK